MHRCAGRLEAAILAAETYKISLDRAQAEAKSCERSEPAPNSADALGAEFFAPPLVRITDETKHREALASVAEAEALIHGELATFGRAFTQVVAG